ncbi:PucR family transcriptional regulator [Peterkaempfera griseoplana]|uniref:PucR family transcriptional regulator n=1 Tax=Peterkaempfera griseoplana TaxID=66896 RepID=UPI0006E2FC88|nr:helix-turn-helix domain-containing protein [Peterkaempfera griseoplana]
MKGLLLRLSALDPDAATAVRVIAHFEALLGVAVDATALVRSTAGLAECPAGLELADGRTMRFGPDGMALPGAPGEMSGAVALGPAGRVWLERQGGPGPLDELVLEWMAIAARVLDGAPRRAGAPHVADPALVELVLSEREAVEDRARALRLLGMAPDVPLRVAAAAGGEGDPGVQAVAVLGRSALQGTVRVAGLGPLGVALIQRREGTASPAAELLSVVGGSDAVCGGPRDSVRGVRVGVGAAVAPLEAGASWTQARSALRFAVAGDPVEAVVDHDELGPVALLADIPVERLRAQPEVRALQELAGREAGELNIAALAAFCRTGSLRQAAAGLHLHHSSVAARLAHVEDAMGWRLRDPQDRFRAQLALYARRLSAD